jgi:teichuronic acid biosynthesis glycosyltransferase TuaG
VLVSVVVSTYNRLPLLCRALETIAAQTHREWESLVCDDGSTDGTQAFVRELSGRDPRVRLVVGPRYGLPAGPRNHGIAAASGDWIAFLDDDDLWHPSKLERQIQAAEGSVDAVATALIMFPEQDPPVWRDHDVGSERREISLAGILLHQQPYPSTPTVMVRRTRLIQAGGFAEHASYRAVEDYDLWARLRSRPDFCWRWIGGVPLSAAREHGSDSISAWQRWFHPDVVRQRWAMLEILTRTVAAERAPLLHAFSPLLAAITDLADDCAHRSAMLGWRSDSLFAYRLAAAFSRARGDAVGGMKRYARALRYSVMARPTARAEQSEHVARLRERIARAARAVISAETWRSDPIPVSSDGRWSTLGNDEPISDDANAQINHTA